MINYNTREMTEEAIASVFSKTEGLDYEIILVDNASTDGSKAFFESKEGIKYVYSDRNLGFGQGNNLGLQYATGRNVFFLNSDTLLKNNAVKILSDYLDSHQDVGVCGGNLYDYNNKPTISYEMKRPGILREINVLTGGRLFSKLYHGNYRFNNTQKTLKVGYISGADLMVRKSVLDQCGAFSPAFFMYYEETEMTYRIHKAGYKIVSVPQAEIIHLQGMSIKGKSESNQINETKITWMYNSFWRYNYLCNSWFENLLVCVIHLFGFRKSIIASHLRHDAVSLKNEKIKRKIFIESYNSRAICQ